MDYSQISCYSACPRKYRNKYILRLEKLAYEEQDVPKEFGKCIHKALEIRDKEGLERGVAYFKENFKELEGDNLRTTENGITTLGHFVDWEKRNFPTLEVLASEIKDSYLIWDVPFTVKLDRVVRFNGNIYCMDYKVVSSRWKYFFKDFEMSHQTSAYCNYVLKKFGQCSGFFPIQILIGDLKKPKLFSLDREVEARSILW